MGSGELLGKGYMQGTQSQLRFLPARHTDFAFAVLAEERGFIGVLTVLSLYLYYLWSGVRVAGRARDRQAILLVVGLLAVLSFHVLYNTAMSIGLVPITGIPLPFLSYGGSFTLWSFFVDRPHPGRRLPPLGERLTVKKTLLIERDPHQTRVAVLENDRLAELALERHRHRGLVGNLYKGRVTRVLPGMQAAFVDLGLERDAFLYVSDAVIEDDARRPRREPTAPPRICDGAENGGDRKPHRTMRRHRTTRRRRSPRSPSARRSSTCSSRGRRSWSRCARSRSPARARG